MDEQSSRRRSARRRESDSELSEKENLMILRKMKPYTAQKEIVIECSIPPNSALDIDLAPTLVVTGIHRNSCFLFRLIVGDQILSINGLVPMSPKHALDIIRTASNHYMQCHLKVSRCPGQEPVPLSRAMKLNLTRHDGFCYFIARMPRIDNVRIGLFVRLFRGKILVNRILPNSLVSLCLHVGDFILDVNAERATDPTHLQKAMISSLKKFGSCTMLIERPYSQAEINNSRIINGFLILKDCIDPPMPMDTNNICHRELFRMQSNQMARPPQGIYIKGSAEQHQPRVRRSSSNDSPARLKKHKKQPPATTDSVYMYAGKPNEVSTRRVRKKHKSERERRNVGFCPAKPMESAIATDVENPEFLQKIQGRKPANSLTFMPKFMSSAFGLNNSHKG